LGNLGKEAKTEEEAQKILPSDSFKDVLKTSAGLVGDPGQLFPE
jgi:hypothetical protein